MNFIKVIVVFITLLIAAGAIFYDISNKPDTSLSSTATVSDLNAYKQLFPATQFTTMDGNVIDVNTLDEPVILVHFWATWCAPCLVEFPLILDMMRDLKGKIALVAISLDHKQEPLDRFIAKQKTDDLPVHWVHDSTYSIAYKKFLISQVPETIIVGPKRYMQKKMPDARLLICGEGPDRVKIKNLISELGLKDCVRLLGFVDNIYAEIKAADALILSSRHEGFGNALVEAMALGTSMIASDCPYGPHEITKGGTIGHLFPVGGVEALQSSMKQVLKKPLATEDELKKYAEIYGLEAVAADYLSLLSS